MDRGTLKKISSVEVRLELCRAEIASFYAELPIRRRSTRRTTKLAEGSFERMKAEVFTVKECIAVADPRGQFIHKSPWSCGLDSAYRFNSVLFPVNSQADM